MAVAAVVAVAADKTDFHKIITSEGCCKRQPFLCLNFLCFCSYYSSGDYKKNSIIDLNKRIHPFNSQGNSTISLSNSLYLLK